MSFQFLYRDHCEGDAPKELIVEGTAVLADPGATARL